MAFSHLTSAILFRDFLCKGTACIRSSSTAFANGFGYYGSLPQIEDGLSAPSRCSTKPVEPGFALTLGGWVFRFILYTVYLPYPSFFRCQSCIKIIPDEKPKSFKKRETRKCLTI